MKKFTIVTLAALTLTGCATTKPASIAQQCPPPPEQPFTLTTDEKSGDYVLTPKNMDNLVVRWNEKSKALIVVEPDWGVAQVLNNEIKVGKFKKPEEGSVTPTDKQKALEQKK